MARQNAVLSESARGVDFRQAKAGHLEVEACVADGADALCDGIASDSREANGL